MKSMIRFIATVGVTATLATVIVLKTFGSPSAAAEPSPEPSNVTLEPIQIAQAETGSATPQPAKAAEAPDTNPALGSGAGATPQPPAGSGAPAPAGSGSNTTTGTVTSGAGSAAGTAPGEMAWYDKLVNKPVHEEGNYWMPKSVNTVTDDSDFMFFSVLGLSAFFFFAIAAAVIYLVIKYRHRPGHKPEPSAAHNDALEVTWTVIPTIICVFLFYYGWRAYIHIVTPPQKAVEINVLAMRWSWNFTHSNGVEDSDLHVPVNTPVRLVMTSKDVLHAFYVPVLRTKQDIIPRRYTYVWFNATKPGTYRLNCAEYCGTNHSQMGITGPTPDWPQGRRAVVVVHEPGGYERYLSDKAASSQNMEPDKLGAMLYEKKGCNACHTTDGSARVGPSFKGSFGTEAALADGSKVKVDENYIRESLMSPQAKARPGFPPSMPSFEGQLKEKEIEGIIAFIKSLK